MRSVGTAPLAVRYRRERRNVMSRTLKIAIATLSLAGSLGLSACGATVEQKAATGAIAGAVVAGPVGAAVGGAAGTVAGQADD